MTELSLLINKKSNIKLLRYNQNIMFTTIELKDIGSLYSTDNTHRYHNIIHSFKQIYGNQPSFIARAPGRVNIIGEHIDYEGYGVLPAAIEKDCLIAVRVNNSQNIRLNHVQSNIYPPTSIPVNPQTKIQFVDNYVKYFRAGYRAGVKLIPTDRLKGFDAIIQGNVPLAAGVSSSSALCVCSALAALNANGGDTTSQKQQFIQRVITGERQTGTASGGMDQSISIMGKTNFCLYIQFHPIRCTPVHLPQQARFVIINSLVESAKLQTAVFRYNKRVCQCRMAVAVLAKKLKLPGKQCGYKILKQIEEVSGLPLNSLGKLVDNFIEKKDYKLSQIQEYLGFSATQLLADIPLHKQVLAANKTYKLYEASKHVFDEAYRVINYIEVCKSQLQDKDKMVLLGALMNQSQTSCRDLYQCSCPQLDEITELAVKAGAYGSRLTGAGWGGCTVSLIDAEHSQSFIQKMIECYFNKKPQLQIKIQKLGIQNIIFESIPSEGACIINITQ